MSEQVTFVFVSNYLNHHQIPFCNAMNELTRGSFVFIQTEPVEEERIKMGWNATNSKEYLKLYYEDEELCKEYIASAKVVLFGGTDNESFIEERLEAGKPVIRYSERLYKTGQWKAVSPRGLKKKYHDHTRYRKAPVYLLCSGAYVPSDFHIVHAYPEKMYCWGYFPETKRYDLPELMSEKGWPAENGKKIPYLLWAARMIDWKHPELPLQVAKHLKEKGLTFHMGIIGGGEYRPMVENLLEQYELQDFVSLLGFLTPSQVREQMEKANIYLFTSDRQEGWGAVANESMNSGCALLANHMIGAAPYLVRPGENGLLYRDGDVEQLLREAERLVGDPELCRMLGENAYETITKVWNAENAAARLARLCINLNLLPASALDFSGTIEIVPRHGLCPCSPAPVISERKMYRYLHGE